MTWCSRVVNRTCGSLPAASRTPRSPIDTPTRFCARGVAVCKVFLSVDCLPSTVSAGDLPLFDGFSGTTQPSDFPEAYMPDVWHCAFSGRPASPSWAGTSGISRFPCKQFLHMLRVFDCAGPSHGSRLAPCSVLPSASDNSVGVLKRLISQLNGWPVCTPVNASPVPLWAPAHDSGPVWLARPSPYGSFIHNSLPVLTGASTRSPQRRKAHRVLRRMPSFNAGTSREA